MIKAVSPILFVACALAATIHAPVRAEAPILVEGQPTVFVPYGDLDLSRPAGRATLNGRVHRAADTLCAIDVRGIGPVMEARRCRDTALTSAHVQVDRAITLYGTAQLAGRIGLSVAGR